MKSLVTSLTAVGLLSLVVLIGGGLANDVGVWCCGGFYDGCPPTTPDCVDANGNCPNTDVEYFAVKDVTFSVTNCVPSGKTSCNNNFMNHFCEEYAYDGQDGGVCGMSLCDFFQDVPQCIPITCN